MPTQVSWTATGGCGLWVRPIDTTSKPAVMVRTTGGDLSALTISPPTVSGEELEWASLLASERKVLVRKRVKPGAVAKAIREVRYSR